MRILPGRLLAAGRVDFASRCGWGGYPLLLAAALLLAACSPGPAIAENAPASVEGGWTLAASEGGAYLLFLGGGEFRAAASPALLFDAPFMTGRYEYDAGRLRLSETGSDDACQEAGTYLVVAYDEPGGPGTGAMTLQGEADGCGARAALFDGSRWLQAAPEG